MRDFPSGHAHVHTASLPQPTLPDLTLKLSLSHPTWVEFSLQFCSKITGMDKDELAKEIALYADQFINRISEFTTDQLNIVPFENSWTAGQVAHHIIKATDGLPDEKTEIPARQPDQLVEELKAIFLDFNAKYQSPDFVLPGNGPYDKNSLLMELERIKKQNMAIALTKDISLLCKDFEFPGVGYLTRFEWLKFMTFHTQRHLHQLNKIKPYLVFREV